MINILSTTTEIIPGQILINIYVKISSTYHIYNAYICIYIYIYIYIYI